MDVIVVDDEFRALNCFLKTLREVLPESHVNSFTKSEEALRFLTENPADIAFLDIEMDGYTGIELAEKYNAICPRLNIIFVTGYSQYSMDALKLHASGYLMKPVRAEDLQSEIEHLRFPIENGILPKVKIQTFGNFEVFINGRPIRMTASKARECLAYLVDRKGARVTFSELSSVLWEERPYDRAAQNNVHRTVSNLMQALVKEGIEDIVIRNHKDIAIDMKKVDCDYYHLLEGNKGQHYIFTGEYMTNYSWAETTLGELTLRMGSKP